MITKKYISASLTVALFIIMLFSISIVSAAEELECGSSFDEEADGDTVSYDLEVEEGDYYVILLSSDDFDTIVEIYEDGDFVDSNDDGGEGLNSRIAIATEGDYEIIVSAVGGEPDGDYELEVACAGNCETFEGELTDDDTALQFEFEAEEDDQILLSVVSEDFDTYLNLQDDDEDTITEDDDGGNSLNSLITYEIEDDGDYIAEVTSFSGEEEGDFELTICLDAEDIESPDEDASAFDYEILSCGDSTEGTIDDGFPVILYIFQGEEGDEITITMEASRGSDLDTYIGLFTPDGLTDGDELAVNDDANGTDSELEYEIEEDGTYIITATRFGLTGGTSEGDFELEIDCD